MKRATITLPPGAFSDIVADLLPAGSRTEEAVFGFAKTDANETQLNFFVENWQKVPASEFTHRSAYYLELSEGMQARLLKMAHDRKCSLIEFHSHPFELFAQFSSADVDGFGSFVPHVLWRLKKRPYAAAVIAQDSLDAIAWSTHLMAPIAVDGIMADGTLHQSTGATYAHWRTYFG